MKTNYLFNLSKACALSLGVGALCSNDAFAQCTSIIDADFNSHSNKVYTVADAKSDFNNKVKPWTASTYRGLSAPGASSSLISDVKQTTRIVDGELRAHYTKNDAGGYAGGFLFDPYFDGVDEAYLEYKLKFDDNFFWATGGKLPGLGGSTRGINSETEGRGAIPSGRRYDESGTGFSARLMWRRNREQTNDPYLILYSYFAEKKDGSTRRDNQNGDDIRIFTGLQDNKWYTIRQYIKLNTPGQDDGTVIMWIDGNEVYRKTTHNIRQNTTAGRNLKINALVMNTYRGGARTDAVWHSPRDEYAFFDDFKVWTGCPNPPNTGVNQAPTGSFLNPTFDEIQVGYNELYVNVEASDPDGDDVDVTLNIDGNEVRTERGAPFEFGHNPVDPAQDFTDETRFLTPGPHLFEAVIVDARGESTTISKTITVTEPKAPYSGIPMAIPGVLEMEDYDKGGLNVSYKDIDVENRGGAYRSDQVDITPMDGGHAIGWISNGEWLEYTVNVQETGNYDLTVFYAANLSGAQIGLSSNGNDLFTGFELPISGGFNNYTTTEKTQVMLEEGEQVLRFNVEQNGFNIDKIVFAPSTITSNNEEFALESLVIFPNPNSTGVFNLTHSTEWKVLNTQGVVVAEGAGKQVDLSRKSKGIYTVQFSSGKAQRIVIN